MSLNQKPLQELAPSLKTVLLGLISKPPTKGKGLESASPRKVHDNSSGKMWSCR